MIPIISEKQARYLDKKTVQSGISESQLMKNAGFGIAKYFMDNIIDPFSQSVLVTAGPGNNGGDAIIARYYLNHFGIQSSLMVVKKKQLESQLFKQYSIPNDKPLVFKTSEDLPKFDWIIDGIFGIGLTRNIIAPYSKLIKQINNNDNVISVDIPSGINADTGKKSKVNVIADTTLTFGYPKLGHFLNDGINATGKLHTIDIGFTNLKLVSPKTHLLSIKDIKKKIKPLKIDANKYSRGRVGIIAGSLGMTGAGILVAKSSFKSGAGIVKMSIPKSLNNIFETNLIETITDPLDDNNLGYLSENNFSNIIKTMDWSDCLICGPGLSSNPKSKGLIKKILNHFKKRLILDGTGFAPLIDCEVNLSNISKESILTPHYAEFSKIFNYSIIDIKNNPLTILRTIIPKLQGRVLILKGSPTFICTSKGDIEICNFGKPSLATAGTGDILSGILGGLFSQDYSIDDVARIGVMLHSIAGNIFTKNIVNPSFTAMNLVESISLSWEMLLSES